ncbi:MAG: BTAD domain-containing putative transcriptional regulator, partial [Actinomycetota bacterium]
MKQRSVLALLIANRGRAVSADRIVDDLYGEDAGGGARRSVQTFVSMMRRELGDAVTGTSDGYVFDAPREAVDASRFEDLVTAGLDVLEDHPERAAVILRDALGLWRGEAYAGVDGRAVFEPEIARLTELRIAALEARIEADLACGRHRRVLPELEALTTEHPLSEHLWGSLMLALYRVGRQADALAAYQQLRTLLGEQLGIDPSPELRQREEQILLQDPALDYVAQVPHNLPAQLTSFIGRRLERIEIGELLTDTRLVTLTGVGGSGKTRLAVEFARQALDAYPDGVWFVDLRGINDPTGVASLIVSTLGVVTTGRRGVVDQLVDALWSRRLLLVLDNCEHVLDGVAPLVERLVSRDDQVRVLATSREPLGVPGESTMLINPLPIPDSTELFTERALHTTPEFALEEHVDSVMQICRAVEGLPLAVELAAARLRIVAPEELARHIGDQLAMLRTTRKAGDLRHATIEATIQWSWDLLDDAEQILFARLSVFRETWTLEAVGAVCGYQPVDSALVLDLVGSLVDKSLVVVDRLLGGSTRYRLLEPVRQFAARELDDESIDRLHNRLVDYWTSALAGSYDPETRFVWRDHERARALEPDQANLTAAVDWALASGRYEDAMAIFASPFGDLLLLQGSSFEATSIWVQKASEHRDAIQPGVLLSALEVAGNIAVAIGRHDATLGCAELGIEISRTPEERRWFELAGALATQRLEGHSEATNAVFGRVAADAEEPGLRASALFAEAFNNTRKRAWMLTQQAMDISSVDSPLLWDECRVSVRVFDAAEVSGHYDVAMKFAHRALDLGRRYGWNTSVSETAALLACLYAESGRFDEAAALIAEAVPVARRILGTFGPNVDVLQGAARMSRVQGDLDQAQRYVDEALNSLGKQHDLAWWGMGPTIESALIARDVGDLDQAREILDDAARLLNDLTHTDIVPWVGAMISAAQASVEVRRSDPDRALEALSFVLREPDAGVHLTSLEAVDLTAIAFAQQGRAELAARLKGAVDRERDDCGLVIQPPDLPVRESAMRRAQTIFGSDWEAAVEQGREMTLDEAIELA